MMGAMGVWMLLWALVPLGLLVLVVLGILRLTRGLGHGGRERSGRAEAPEDILRRRYAAGEIDEDEYLRRRSGLSQP